MNISNCLKLAEIFLVYVSFTFFASLSQAAVHTHFDAEKSKPGVFLYRDYRSNSNACQDWVSKSKLTCGASPGGYYDATLDGFVIPIVEGVNEAIGRSPIDTSWRDDSSSTAVSAPLPLTTKK